MIKRILLSLIALAISIFCFSQPPGDPAGGVKPDTTVPITGIEILISIGGLIGVKRLLRNRKVDSKK